jgi:hypothetical protein
MMPELILPIVALGLALATIEHAAWRWVLLSLAAGLALGFLIPLAVPDGFALAAMFITIGAMLICSNGWVQRLIVPISFFIAGYAGHVEAFSASHDLQSLFLQTALLLLVAVAVTVAQKNYRVWFSVPRRIGGSWLLAAGSMLLAVLIRAPESPVIVSGAQSSPLHDPNQPHIHGANGEIIYLPSKGEQPSMTPKK